MDSSFDSIERHFHTSTRDDDLPRDLIFSVDSSAVGLLQCYRWEDNATDIAAVAHIVTVPAGAVSLDYLIGDVDCTGHGLGPRVLAEAISRVWRCYSDTGSIIVPVVAANRPSWRALEKVGFRRVGSGDLTPENPLDPALTYVYRVDRPVLDQAL